jgi:glycosyltransferase involved in cell wall biosynthesis
VRDPASLAEAMTGILQAGPEQRRAWGRSGRERVEREFDETIVARLYIEAIEAASP